MDLIAHSVLNRRNNHYEHGNDIRQNDNAIRRHNYIDFENNNIPNGDAFRENNRLEDEDNIGPNNVIREDNEVENDIIPNDFNNINENENDVSEYEDDIGSLNGFDHNKDKDKDGNGYEDEDEDEDENEGEIENEDEGFRQQLFRVRLHPPKLEHIKNVLYVGMSQFFKEIEIEVVRCPDLTKPPFNLAAEGLSGKTVSWEVGTVNNFVPVPQTNITYNIPLLLIKQNVASLLYKEKFCIIGSGYAAKPSMPSNGHLTMNTIVFRATKVINNNCIVYEEANTRRRKLITIDKPNQLICSMLGNFFISKGRLGKVIKVRAKGRKGNYDIISLIQRSLYTYFQYPIRLGGVLLMDGGRLLQHITPENYPERMNSHVNFYTWPNCYELNCMDLIAIGTIGNLPPVELQIPNEPFLIDSRFKFNTFSNYEAAGQFVNDVTPNDTEYIGYFNVAQYSLI